MTSPVWLSCPTISIGNLSMGGRGKTPMVIFLSNLLVKQGFEVVVLTRGYGRKSSEPLFMTRNASLPNPSQSGDEALEIFLRGGAEVLVGSSRLKNFQAFEESRAKSAVRRVALLDDGFQHWAIHRDLDVVLVQKADFFERVLPVGPLREDSTALKRAHVVLEEQVDFRRRPQLMGEVPGNLAEAGVLTTRAPTSRDCSYLKEVLPNTQLIEMHLPDHADETEMRRALEDFKGDHLILGWKEAVKLVDLESLQRKDWKNLWVKNSPRKIKVILSELHFEFLKAEIQQSFEAKIQGCLTKSRSASSSNSVSSRAP